MKKAVLSITCILLVYGLFSASAQTTQSEYRMGPKIRLDGDGGWDYLTVDESGNRLFVSHGTQVNVVDLKTGKSCGTIPDTKGVHGIALAPDLNKGFISCGRDSSVTVFDFTTLKTLGKIKVTGKNPDAILYDFSTKRVITYNGGSSNATVIDAQTGKVISTIPLAGKPEFSVSDGKGRIYVNIEDKSLMTVIDARNMTVAATWPIAPGEEPSGLALDNENHRLFIVCSNKMMVIMDAVKGRVITTLPIGERVDGVAFDPVLKRAYSSNGDGTMTVVLEENKDTFKVIENVQTQKGARTIALHPQTHHLYLPVAEYDAAPAPTADNPKPRPPVRPGTFTVLDMMLTK